VQTPTPVVGQAFTAATGILAFRFNDSKLEPRNAGDLEEGAPLIASFGPALSFARVGNIGAPTFPTPLTVTLTGPAKAPMQLAVSSNSAALAVQNVTIQTGESSVVIQTSAALQDSSVTITVSLEGGPSQTADVRVLGTNEQPTSVTLAPAATTVTPGGTVTFTATLDIPPPADTTITLSQNPAGAGTLPGSITIAADTLSKSFDFTNNAAAGQVTVTATFAGGSADATMTVSSAASHLVISQVYGGGGNSGAPFKNDFVELFNPGPDEIPLSGMSLQYASATGSSWLITALPNINVAPGGYVLVKQAGGTTGADLPAADVTGTTNMGAGAGKVALVNDTAALSGACPTTGLIDFVGYGSTANCFETARTPAPSNTTSVSRALAGCQDTDNNASDFASGAPAPRNSAATPTTCN
jgi:hypothetical protein